MNYLFKKFLSGYKVVMKKMIIVILSLILIILGIRFIFFNTSDDHVSTNEIAVSEALADDDVTGFERAVGPVSIKFPDALGSHKAFKNEWWYFTGNLVSDEGSRFGFQLTIFRIGVKPDSESIQNKWSADNIYMAHFALTDIENNRFYYFERFARGAAGLSGASVNPLTVWVEDWKIMESGNELKYGIPTMKINASQDGKEIDIKLENTKMPVLQGDSGYSRKGRDPGNASYYFSFTRLKTNGSISINNFNYKVEGYSWMDKEWSTSSLDSTQAGWDWFALQLNDGSEIMYYQLRKKDGSPDIYSSGIIIDKSGKTERINFGDAELTVIDYWKSPTGIKYPSKWNLKVSKKSLDLTITPFQYDQELKLTIRYWEGAVKLSGKSSDKEVQGKGYAELTGYANIPVW